MAAATKEEWSVIPPKALLDENSEEFNSSEASGSFSIEGCATELALSGFSFDSELPTNGKRKKKTKTKSNFWKQVKIHLGSQIFKD